MNENKINMVSSKRERGREREREGERERYILFFFSLVLYQNEWRHLIAGGAQPSKKLPNPASDWLSDRSWSEVLSLTTLDCFAAIAREFTELQEGFKRIFDSLDPHKYG